MAVVAQQAWHFGASCSTGAFNNSGSPDCAPCCSAVRSSASSGFQTPSNFKCWVSNDSECLHRSGNGAITKGKRQRPRECWGGGRSVSYGGGCRDRFGHRVLLRFPSFEEVPLLQLHLPDGGLPARGFVSSCAQAFRKLHRPSDRVFAFVNCFAQWHNIGTLGLQNRSLERMRANRGDDSGNTSKEERKGTGADEKDESNREELTQEVEEAPGKARNDSKMKDEEDEAGDKEPLVQKEVKEEWDTAGDKETVLRKEDFKTVLWRKIMGPGQDVDDDSLSSEEELILQDLENATFNWKALLDPTWENVIALGFVALLSVALIKILSQLVIVVMTILLAALKYTVLAAFLVGLLIFVL